MKKLIIFDLDGTIIDGDGSAIWRNYLSENKLMDYSLYREREERCLVEYNDGSVDLNAYFALCLAPVMGMPGNDIEALFRNCGKEYVTRYLFDDARQALNDVSADDDSMIISGSVNGLVNEAAKAFGVKYSIGTKLLVSDMTLIPEFDGIPSFGEGKVIRLKEWLEDWGRDNGYYDKIVCYANSINDLTLLEFVDEAYAVNPCKLLSTAAKERGWPILEWGNDEEVDLSEAPLEKWNAPCPKVTHKKLTVFDLDETLFHGEISSICRAYFKEKGVITDPEYTKKEIEYQRQYDEETLDLAEYFAFSMGPFVTIPATELEEELKECVRTRVIPHVFDEAKALVNELRANDEKILIISGTATFIAQPIANELGIKNIVAVNLIKKDGCYTGEASGTLCFREGKVKRLKQWLVEQSREHIHYDDITFYTDSINDLPLCNFSDTVYTVNPCEKLRPIAKERGWEILSWGTNTAPSES